MSRASRTIALVGTLCGLLGLGGFVLRAALASASTRHSVRVGSAPRVPAGSKVVGSLSKSARLNVTVFLKPRNPAALAAYATAVATPGSSVFHQYLTVPQFAARFGATQGQLKAVRSALRARGLDPGAPTVNDLSIPVRASAGKIAHAFSIRFHRVALRGGRRAFANTAAPLLPGSIAGYVQYVNGLNNVVTAQPMGLTTPHRAAPRVTPHVVTGGPQPCAAATSAGTSHSSYTADQLASAYQFSSLYAAGDEGSGQTVAIYEMEPFSSTDISSYQTCYGTTASVTIAALCGGCTSPGTGAGSGEAALDIEDVVSLAPKANVVVYEGTNGDDNLTVYQQIANANAAKVVSTSWGFCEATADYGYSQEENTVFEQMATQGQSMFAASGDDGSEVCGGSNTALAVDDPANDPYVTGVGGTTLSALGPPPTESVWDDGVLASHECGGPTPCGGGGGISTFYTMPSYQTGAAASLNVINTNSSKTLCSSLTGTTNTYCREVPDVSADADPYTGYVIYYNGAWGGIGGTSAAAPTWAAFMALVDASSGCTSAVGFANPVLYGAADHSYGDSFNDIKSGNNDVQNAHSGLYPAGTGYDMASGLGTPVGSALPSVLCAADTVKAIGTVSLPDPSSLPTGVVVDKTNHIAYVAESAGNAVAEITKTSGTSFSGSAMDLANPTLCATTCALPGLNFPDDLALNASGQVLASDFCDGALINVCSSEVSGTTTAVSQQTGTSAGQKDVATGCSFPSGDADYTATAAARLFVACAGSGEVAACSPSGGGTPACGSTTATTVAIAKPVGGVTPVPSGVAAIPTTTTTPSVVVADASNSTLSVVSFASGALAASTPTSLATGCDPASVAIGPSVSGTADVYVACSGTGTVEVGTVTGTGTPTLGSFTATSLPHLGTSTPYPFGVAVNAFGTALVVTDAANNDAVVYPSLSGTTLGTGTAVATGTTPDGVSMDGGNAFIANESSNNVTVLDPPATSSHQRFRVASAKASAQAAARRTVSLTPLIAPLPARASG